MHYIYIKFSYPGLRYIPMCFQTYSTSIPCIPVYTLYIYTETSYTR